MRGWVKAVLWGWAIYIVLLLVAILPSLFGYRFWYLNRVLLWQLTFADGISGHHPLLGYFPNGEPMYEATPIDGLVSGFLFLAGFVIYPGLALLFFRISSLITRR